MKKYLSMFLAFTLALSCTVSKDDTGQRSNDNIAQMANNLCSLVGDDVVVTVTKMMRDSLELLFSAGLDTTVKSNSYGSGLRIKCVSPADSVLTVEPSDNSGLEYGLTLLLRGRDADGQPLWTWFGNGTYKENEQFSATFRCGADSLKYLWQKYFYYYDYASVDSVYVAVKTGEFYMTSFSGNTQLDQMKLTYKGKDGTSYSLVR